MEFTIIGIGKISLQPHLSGADPYFFRNMNKALNAPGRLRI